MKDLAAPLALFVSILLGTHGLSCVYSPFRPDRSVPRGLWGGEHLALTVDDTGARAEFDCASGEILHPLVVDADGRFSIDGVLVRGHGGPVRQGETSPRLRARYAGTLTGRTLAVSITLTDTREDVGTFAVSLGAAARLMRCY